MFGLCYKNNKKERTVTVYSDILSAIIFVAFMCILPFGIFFIPYFSLLTKCALFAIFSAFLYFFLNDFWHLLTQKIPLLLISNEGIKPILTKDGDLDLEAPLIKWDDIAEIFIYKAPYLYSVEHTAEAGFRYIGIKLRNKEQANSEHMKHPIVIPSVQVIIPYSNDRDIPLTSAHPFTRGLIKWLNHYRQQYLEQRKR